MSIRIEYYEMLAAAFVRGKLQGEGAREAQSGLFTIPLAELTADELLEVIRIGSQAGLRLHRFKRTMELARVRKVLGVLKGLQPQSLLDIGSGRGAFLWPLLDTFPSLPVTCIDLLTFRVTDIQAVHDGGIEQLTALQGNVTALPFASKAFEVVTMLEVLEHVPETAQALAEICRVASKCVILSVPSKKDDNPEHIHLFEQRSLQQLLRQQGIMRCSVDYVPGHMLVVARIEKS